MSQLGMFAANGTLAVHTEEVDDYAVDWARFRQASPQVFARLLELARAELNSGATYLSVKGLWEHLRRWCRIDRAGVYKLNNNWTAYAARDLIVAEPALGQLLRTRGASAAKGKAA